MVLETEVRAVCLFEVVLLPGDNDRVFGLIRLLGCACSGSIPFEATMNAEGGCATLQKGRGTSFRVWLVMW